MNDAEAQLRRCYGNLSDVVFEFCLGKQTQEITMGELFEHVRARGFQFAPDSPSRIFRKLREQGKIAAHVVDRQAGKYFVGVPSW